MDPDILNLRQELLIARRRTADVEDMVNAHPLLANPHPQYVQKAECSIQFVVSPVVASIWALMPAAADFLYGNRGSLIRFDASEYDNCRVVVSTGAAGFAGSILTFAYNSDNTAAASAFSIAGTPGTTVALDTANAFIDTGWRQLVAGAKDLTYFGLIGSGGNGVANPSLYMATVYFQRDGS